MRFKLESAPRLAIILLRAILLFAMFSILPFRSDAAWVDRGVISGEATRSFHLFENMPASGYTSPFQRIGVMQHSYLGDIIATAFWDLREAGSNVQVTQYTLVGLGPDFVRIRVTKGPATRSAVDMFGDQSKLVFAFHLPPDRITSELELEYRFPNNRGTLMVAGLTPIHLDISSYGIGSLVFTNARLDE